MLALYLLAAVQGSSILVFTKTTEFRHDSIPAARQALLRIAHRRKWNVSFTEDAATLQQGLARTSTVVFLLTTGDVLNREQESAFQSYVEGGGGFVGIHSAADTEKNWPWYGSLVGTAFDSHPEIQNATLRIEDRKHPTTSFLPKTWSRRDEWYNFRSTPRGKVRVLATIDESTYKGGTMGKDHPMIWCHQNLRGRSWYTALGHTKESYADERFLNLVENAIGWTMKR